MNINLRPLTSLVSVLLLSGCSSPEYTDLDDFMAQVRTEPQGVIAPIPIFKTYQAFRYNAAAMRSPFEVPVKIREIANLAKALFTKCSMEITLVKIMVVSLIFELTQWH